MTVSAGARQKILEVATRLFSTQGLKSTNIRQIASVAKTNSALIFYYFGCKEKLFFECLKDLATERFKFANELLSAPVDKRDFEVKLGLFVQNMYGVFETKKDLIKILHREIDNNNSKAIKIFDEYFLPIVETLEVFFLGAQKKKIISADFDVRSLTFDFFALLSNPLRNENLLKVIFKDELAKSGLAEFYKKNQPRVIQLFLQGVLLNENS